jgi:hypothetical protein
LALDEFQHNFRAVKNAMSLIDTEGKNTQLPVGSLDWNFLVSELAALAKMKWLHLVLPPSPHQGL